MSQKYVIITANYSLIITKQSPGVFLKISQNLQENTSAGVSF